MSTSKRHTLGVSERWWAVEARKLMAASVLAGLAVLLSTIGTVVGSSTQVAAQEAPVAVASVFVAGSGSGGIYIVYGDGRVDPRDGLPHHGDRPQLAAGESVVSLGAVDDASGYWLFTSAGRVFGYGSVSHHGDLAEFELAAPVIAAAVRPDGGGYWMVGADGGIFAFGTSEFHGSVPEVLPGVPLAAPVIGISPSPSGNGYLLVAADGGIFTFGDAIFYGSIPGVLPGVPLAAPVVGVVPQAGGYLMVASDGGVFNFGQSTFYGSLADVDTNPIATIAVPPGDVGYTMIDELGIPYPLGLQIMLSWGHAHFEATGNSIVDYDGVPWGRVSLVHYAFNAPEPSLLGIKLRATDSAIGHTGWFQDVTPVRRGVSTGSMIPELLVSAHPFRTLYVAANQDATSIVRLAPIWYVPYLSQGLSARATNESVWEVGVAGTETTIDVLLDNAAELIVVFYPFDSESLQGRVLHNSAGGSFGGGGVVSGAGWLTVQTSETYSVVVQSAAP